MPSREEIREGMKPFIIAASDGKGIILAEQASYYIMEYLHSQGVVIKVDRELTASICGYCEHLDSCQETHSECDRFKLEAGYEAVESLI